MKRSGTGRSGVMGRVGRFVVWAAFPALLAACDEGRGVAPADDPAPPRDLDGYYYARAVHLSWELHPAWHDDTFRVYGKRTSDADFFLIAEVTNCAGGACAYTDMNVQAGRRYVYYVAAVSPRSGLETASDYSVEVAVPQPDPPPVPSGAFAVALDDAIYLTWDPNARQAADFAFYRVYLDDDAGGTFLLGETDSEGFLDLRVENGFTYGYFVSAVDDQGHESTGSVLAEGTPRPDYHGELLYAYEDVPELSGFRFQSTEADDPVVDGDAPGRHFRLEVDAQGWWLVPGAATEIHPSAFQTTALKCGPAADAGCQSLDQAPLSGYTRDDVGLLPLHSYALRYLGEDGGLRHAVIRVTLQGADQDGNALLIFDWAHQLQAGNPNLAPVDAVPIR